jgi:HK97 family phage prohead protease
MKLVGHAAVFNSPSKDLGGFTEYIAPGAFTRTLANRHAIYAVHSHNFDDLLGSTRSRSLSLSQDAKGLYFELDLPDTSLGRDVYTLVERGDLVCMSFSFSLRDSSCQRWVELPDGTAERTLLDVDLYEISTVALPAYPDAYVSARHASLSKSSAANDSNALRNRMRKRIMQSKLKVVA